MKPVIQLILFFSIGVHYGFSQDSSILISAKMFDSEQKIALSAIDGWIFREGYDSLWTNKEMNTYGWRKLKPTELSTKLADKTGRVEGLFRLKFRLDNDLLNIPLSIGRGGWAATNIYIDGKFLASFGKIGGDYETYKEYNPIDKLSVPAYLEPGKEHVIALHFVDYLAPISFGLLKSQTISASTYQTEGLHSLLILAEPGYNSFVINASRENLIYRSIWLAVTILLALLFWLLFFQGPGEKKTLMFIGMYSSFCALSNITRFFLKNPDISFMAFRVSDLFFKLCIWMIFVLTLIIATRILNFKPAKGIKIFLATYSILGALSIFFNFFLVVLPVSSTLSFFFYAYIIVTSWKKLTGAQWSIAIGLTLSFLFGVFYGIYNSLGYNKHWQLIITGVYFSLPLSLLVYISLRFREMMKEVREKAFQVAEINKEREKQILTHQKIYKELLELEAQALRARMNPHFIFNSLNSIKSLINKNENEKAAGYLTTFSKLIRTLFQNSDKREVSLYEELETCRFYTQLERMRFADKVDFVFNVDGNIDLKDIKVPALIIQPFIENAIWHGLVPKESGGKVIVNVVQNNGAVECIIDDDGIGRELSAQYKAQYEATHQSKGIGLTQSRLELDKMLNERDVSLQVIDKRDENRNPAGTKVILTFKENEA
jgi:sensor histidine kinase YesM